MSDMSRTTIKRAVPCEECYKDPIHPNKQCCFNCGIDAEKCETFHICGEDCPDWKRSDTE